MRKHANRVAVGLAVFALGCAGPPTLPTPSPSPTPSPTPISTRAAVTVSGTVIEFTSTGERRPVPNLRLRVRDGSAHDSAVGGLELADVVTDSNGRYTMAGVTAFVLFFQAAPGSDHKFLCDWYPVALAVPKPITDLPVVHRSWAGNQPVEWIIGTSVYGTVSERIDGNVFPVAGATVSLDNGEWDPPATTGANGFFMICSIIGTDQFRTISAQKTGYVSADRRIFGGWDYEVSFELTRR